MFKRNKKSTKAFNAGDLVVFKCDKKNPQSIYRVEYVSGDFCNLRLAFNNSYYGWVRKKFLKMLSPVTKTDKTKAISKRRITKG